MLKGIAASSGVAIGKALVIVDKEVEIERRTIENVEAETTKLQNAVATAKEQLEKIKEIAREKIGEDKAQVFEAHLMMLEDPEFIGAVEAQISAESICAEYALKQTADMFISMFESMDNEYMRERAADIRDVSKRIINILMGIETASIAEIDRECIIVINDLTPSDTAQMDKEKVLGFATDIGGRTSHSAIMARSLEIPAVVGLSNVTTTVKTGDMLILDGDEGVVIVNPDEETLQKYREKQQKLIEYKKELSKLVNAESITVDGRKVELAANIGTPSNVEGALKNGAEGVGLFRTEFLYMDKDSLPTEEEQFEAYKAVLEGMEGRPVVIRTLDIGGDKKLPYLKIDEEMNPFLGYRAIRLCLDRKDIFKTQLRALFRASVYGNLKIMFPMISGIEELRQAKAVVEEVKNELKVEGIAYSNDVEIGIMIEIPSAAIVSDILAKEVDFFSIGTNDLIQYTVAVDRMNEKISYLYDPFHPAVLRLIKMVIDNAHKEGKWAGMCGEMAGDERIIPVLLGFGLDEFSMSASSILKARKLITSLNYEEAKKLADEVVMCATSEEIKSKIQNFVNR
ncbi:phosphoenolpyruvate--protein phosphotransferase [Thermobrachium celere]|uniref:Phosphoenolpyruvate-protein phosphotransferase n=1 Tax=Thermobrachium celere DSM 8682 TaxID=941824 RepID=R7RQT4_9CLOT|nr:phosphoenolpyruvate--protein phosphotransferase [Thermobrachium celere]CDF58542.1 Phosphoenolpyruvate-protein phosphotransferase of PTS system [Thermobrachium celere DSM 8682]